MKKICGICGKVYNPKELFIRINKNFYVCEKCFKVNFGEIYEHDKEIDEVWKEINKKIKRKKNKKNEIN